jgi:hypothetical protein
MFVLLATRFVLVYFLDCYSTVKMETTCSLETSFDIHRATHGVILYLFKNMDVDIIELTMNLKSVQQFSFVSTYVLEVSALG